ncbi:MAG: carbamoyltransferase HypF [bacterium]
MDGMAEIPTGGQEAGPGELLRLRVSVRGVVQGVGFRPFVYRLASREGLRGSILNNPQGVVIEIEGELDAAERFLASLVREKPPVARIDSISVNFTGLRGDDRFVILGSQSGAERTTLVSPDIATCGDCLREVSDPADRRHRYPFINCTNCGPRYTIIGDIPYDRQKTSMRKFKMCPDCEREYLDPADRRFHAEPNACWVCGPRVALRDRAGAAIPCDDPIKVAAAKLSAGATVAVKGLGGFHLAVDASNDQAVRLMRQRKGREEKPLAVMTRNLVTAARIAHIGPREEAILSGPERPIVLLAKRDGSPIAESVAPGNRYLGVMLPYNPIQVMLLESGPADLVMTSGNLSEEPIALDMDDAVKRLGGIADLYLDHDREIVSRCDDSVVRLVGDDVVFMRRSRGWAPLPIELDADPPSILACGAHLKNTVALSRGNQVFLSQHIGDLENLPAYGFFTSTIEHLKQMVEVEPGVVAHDLHPDYLATRFAIGLAGARALRAIGVQHHHAHIASCLGEAGLEGPVIGFALDGTGYGADGTVWGGEILLATRGAYTRAGHLEQTVIPGSEAAIHNVWRMALAHLHSAYGGNLKHLPLERLLGATPKEIRTVLGMIELGFNSPVTSSCGRLFDAVSCLVGIRRRVKYEGQAALELEMAADQTADRAYPVKLRLQEGGIVVEVGAMIRELVEEVLAGGDQRAGAGLVSAKFHNWLVRSLVEAARALRDAHGVETAALSGGCFQNARLLGALKQGLEDAGFGVLINRVVPANDGGISYGQTVVAAALAGNA